MAGPANVSTLLLRNVPLFAVLPENQLALLTGVVARKSFPRGTVIINAGDTTSLTFFASLTSDLGTTDSLSNLDVSSASGADTAITVIAEALREQVAAVDAHEREVGVGVDPHHGEGLVH